MLPVHGLESKGWMAVAEYVLCLDYFCLLSFRSLHVECFKETP